MSSSQKRKIVTFQLTDNRYDKPFKYLRAHRAYLVTLQSRTPRQQGIFDVVPEHGDRAVPKGLVRSQLDGTHEAFLYHPGFSADLLTSRMIGVFASRDDAITAILSS